MRVSQIRTTVRRQLRYALSMVVAVGWLVGSVCAQSCPQFAAPVLTGRLTDSRWTDISGLAASRKNPGVFWFHNDGGPGASGSGDFFAVNREGRLLADFRLDGVNSLQARGEGRVDIEDVAVGSAGPDGETYLYFGDIGGNLYPTSRNELRIFRVREPQVSLAEGNTGMAVITDYETFKVSYPNGLRRDAETLMVDMNGDVYIVTKAPNSGTSTVYLKAAPHWDGSTTTLEQVATLQFGSGSLPGNRSATAGDISVDGDDALIRTYSNVFMWVKPPGMTWGDAFASVTPCVLPAAQGGGYEAVAFDHTGTHYYDTYDSQGSTSAAEPLNFYERAGESPPELQFFEVVARHSGKCLDVSGASADNLASVIQWDCHGEANQQWQFVPLGDGYYRIMARHSGKVLDVYGVSTEDLASITQYESHDGVNQQWSLEPVGDGYYRIVARCSGKALDVFGASPENGAGIIQYTPHGGENQQWLLRAIR